MTAATATVSVPRRRRVLAALATMLAAVAIAAASGATFNASSANPGNTYATGTLTTFNSKNNAAIFNATNLKPGDTVVGTVTITNTGTLAAKYTLAEDADNPFTADLLNLVITDTASGAVVSDATLGEAGTVNLGTWNANESRTYRFAATLDIDATNAEQNKAATATYTWNAVQTAPVTIGG
jgi:spore coat-associated protein N